MSFYKIEQATDSERCIGLMCNMKNLVWILSPFPVRDPGLGEVTVLKYELLRRSIPDNNAFASVSAEVRLWGRHTSSLAWFDVSTGRIPFWGKDFLSQTRRVWDCHRTAAPDRPPMAPPQLIGKYGSPMECLGFYCSYQVAPATQNPQGSRTRFAPQKEMYQGSQRFVV